jgi:perosamine synthetase
MVATPRTAAATIGTRIAAARSAVTWAAAMSASPAPTGSTPLHVLTLHEPMVGTHEVTYRWTITPNSALYTDSSFSLRFPPSVDLANVPHALWWRIALICLHPHWALLRPCQVVLPVSLTNAEREFWLRLSDAVVATLEGTADRPDTLRKIEIVDGGPQLEALTAVPDRGGVVCCFSGGKDATTQAALVAELGETPILVTTTAPSGWNHEHTAAPRRELLVEAARRRSWELVEVNSDLPTCADNRFPVERYGVGLNELTDQCLYLANAIVVAFARGSRRVLMASEVEVQDNAQRDGLVVEHSHRQYSVATLHALSAILAPSGVSIGTLTAPLHYWQVQRLLATRYRDLLDMQYSCWAVGEDQQACGRCYECRQVALELLAIGISPADVGIGLVGLLTAQRSWKPKHLQLDAVNGRVLAGASIELEDLDSPQMVKAAAGREREAQQLRCIAQTPPERVAEMIERATTPTTAAESQDGLLAWAELRATAARYDVGPYPGYCPAYLELIDESWRASLAAILDEHFDRRPDGDFTDKLARTRAVSDWITEPLSAVQHTTNGTVDLPEDDREMAELGSLAVVIPGAEPKLEPARAPREGVRDILPVSDTLLEGNELEYLTECVSTNWVSSAGPFVTRFEEAFAEAANCRFAVACASGTAALHLSLLACGVQAGDEVVMPTFTMIATANAARYIGAVPVLVDADPETWNIDIERIAEKIGPRTRAIVVVHTYGRPVAMAPVLELAERHGLMVIEDAAEAHGAQLNGQRVGSFGHIAAFSFYGNKILTAGEGGMVTTNDERLAKVARNRSGHAFSTERHFWHRHLGFNYRMTNVQAAVGLAQTERLEELLERRRVTARRYIEALIDVPGITHAMDDDVAAGSAWWMFGIIVDDDFPISRDQLRERLAAAGIETRTFFIPLHAQPLYRAGFVGQRYPVAEQIARTGLYLPSGPNLSAAEIGYVAEELRRASRATSGRSQNAVSTS